MKWAVYENRPLTVRTLIANGADPTVRAWDGNAYDLANQHSKKEVLLVLEEYDKDPKRFRQRYGSTKKGLVLHCSVLFEKRMT